MKISILFFLLIFFNVSNGNSSSYFVDPTNGHDNTGNGTFGNPYKTIEKIGFMLNVIHCDTIYILGSYHYGVKDELQRNDNQTYWIYIRPYNGANVTLDGHFSTPDSWKAILGVQSSKYVDIKNISVTGNDSASGFRVVSDNVNQISQFVNIRYCHANNCRRQGILIQAKDVTVENCEIDSVCLRNQFQPIGDSGWDFAMGTLPYPISLGWCSNITFRNNYVHNAWGEGIVVERGRNFVIEENTVKDCFSACIYADNSRYGIIQRNWLVINGDYYNRMFDPNYSARASGIFWASEGAYHQDSIVQNIDIVNNLIVSTGTALGWFDAEDNPSIFDSYRKINIYYNTIFDTKSYMTFYIDTLNVNPNRLLPDSCNFKNNIICRAKWQNHYERYTTYSNDFIAANHIWTIQNNCFIHGIDPRFPNNITGPPSFIDSTNFSQPSYFKLTAGSNCIVQGVYINSIIGDFFNLARFNPPCIGFHEFGGIPIGIHNYNNEIPGKFALYQNFPNPFNPTTEIKFSIPTNGVFMSLKIYDIDGKQVETLGNKTFNAGNYQVNFDGSNLSSGIYFYKIELGNFTESKKMVLVK